MQRNRLAVIRKMLKAIEREPAVDAVDDIVFVLRMLVAELEDVERAICPLGVER